MRQEAENIVRSGFFAPPSLRASLDANCIHFLPVDTRGFSINWRSH